MSRRVLITGAAGYIGRQVAEQLLQQGLHVVGVDRQDNPDLSCPLQIIDIRDQGLADLLAAERITHVVHLASIVSPGRDEALEYDIDVNGTRNVLDACLAAKVQHITVLSSGAAYGYHADSPEWLSESDPLRGNDVFSYAKHKRLVEELLAQYRGEHPQLHQLILRPGTVLGATTNNMITKLFEGRKLLAIKGSASPFVFIWDQDLITIIAHGVGQDKTGIYNVAGDGALSIHELAGLIGKPVREVSASLLRSLLRVTHALKLTTAGANHVLFLQYRPVLANQALKEDFGYMPQKSSREAFLFYWQHAQQRLRA